MTIIKSAIGIVISLGLILTTGCMASQADFDKTQEKIDSIDTDVKFVKSGLTDLQSRIDIVNKQLVREISILTEIQNQISMIESEKDELVKLQSQITILQEEISYLKSLIGIAGQGTETQPLIWYDFEDGFLNAGTTSDKLNYGPDLNIYNVDQGTGIHGKCVSFSSSGYLQANSNPVADFTTMTVSLWFNTPTPTNNYKLAAAAWWHGGLDASGWTMATHCPEAWADNQQEIFTDGRHCTRPLNFTPNAWIHMVITHDGYYFREYINGELTLEDTTIPGVKIGRGSNLTIGSWNGGFLFNGRIDEVMIYNRALKPEEVRALSQGLLE
jgi:tetrahydromethanopterin S-methyltransferase subunit G